MIEEYLKLVKGFIHEANEPKAVFKHNDTYCALLRNDECDNYLVLMVLMVHAPTMTVPYTTRFKSHRAARALFDKLKAGNSPTA